MHRHLVSVLVLAALGLAPATAADKKAEAKEALKALNDFIGQWKGSGQPVKPRPQAKEIWNETIDWGWRFKGDDAWLTLEFKSGRQYKAGELRYVPAKEQYELTLTDKAGKKAAFTGKMDDAYLKLERIDPESKETQRLTLNTAGDGARLIVLFEKKAEGRTLFVKDFQIACTKEGESLGKQGKKPECVVSGGLGTMTVSFGGETYYVCCSGCRDAFMENPEKYVKEFKAKKAAGK